MTDDENGGTRKTSYGPWRTVIRIAGICGLIVGLGFAGHLLFLWFAG